MWRLIHHPTSATLDDIMAVIFCDKRYDIKRRYFIQGYTSKRTYSKQPLDVDDHLTTKQDLLQTNSTPYQRIKAIVTPITSQERSPAKKLEGNFIRLDSSDSEVEDVQYCEDRIGQHSDVESPIPCPATLQEAMFLVSEARRAASTHEAYRSPSRLQSSKQQHPGTTAATAFGHEVYL